MKHGIIESLIQEFRNRECNDIERALLNLDALPIPWAWEGCFGICLDGSVVYVDGEGMEIPVDSFDTSPSSATATLVYAVRRNPALTCILPTRPLEAKSCISCDGSGRFLKIHDSALCSDCDGLGWRTEGRNAA